MLFRRNSQYHTQPDNGDLCESFLKILNEEHLPSDVLVILRLSGVYGLYATVKGIILTCWPAGTGFIPIRLLGVFARQVWWSGVGTLGG